MEEVMVIQGRAFHTGKFYNHLFNLQNDDLNNCCPLMLAEGDKTQIITIRPSHPLMYIAYYIIPYGKRDWQDNYYYDKQLIDFDKIEQIK